MHDAIIAERLGIPAVAILTTAFVSAGDLMARVLGAEAFQYAITTHPISSAGTAALRDRAHDAVADSVRILCAS